MKDIIEMIDNFIEHTTRMILPLLALAITILTMWALGWLS